MAAFGVYVGNSTADLNKFSSWLGDKPDYVHGVVGYANWTDYVSSASWQAGLWKSTGIDVQWSVPIISKEGNLGTAASGAYNTYYKQVAEALLKNTPGDGPIMVRTGWEANGDWFFWNAIGKEEAFKGAFRQMASTFKQVSDRFQFEWNINHANGGTNPESIYPGDEYVDVIGMDFYYKPEYQGSDPAKAFYQIRDEKYGLQWLENFAAAHGKPTAYSEWGVTGNNAAPFVQLAKQWFDSHNVVLQSYWDSDSAYPGKLSDGTDANTGAAFKAAFANWGSGDMTWADFGGGSSAPVPAPEAMPDVPTQNGGDATAGKPPGADDPVVPTAPVVTAPAPSPSSGAPAESAGWSQQFWGSSAKETITGSAGNDQINGGGGDTLKGGAGDDTYLVTTGDVVVEAAGQGIDTVMTWINNYVLPDNVENLILTGTGWNSLTGNGLANRLIGNDSPNTLNGRAGNDWLTGGGGNDTFVIAKGEGNDTITDFSTSGGDVIRLDGFAFRDFAAVKAAATQAGSDVLINLGDGQTLTLLATKLASLAADDFALVNIKSITTAPVVTAPVVTAPTTTAPTTTAPVVTAPAPSPSGGAPAESAGWSQQFWGSSAKETITGSAGNDQINGGGGDTLKGGAGDDTYLVTTGDVVVEAAGQGIDTVMTWINNYVLPDNVENLILTGTGWNSLTGNGLANRLIGNDSPNTLNGRAGNDWLTGGGGNDTFVIAKGEGNDTITDFSTSGGDVIRLDGFAFRDFAAVKAAATQAGSDVLINLGDGQTLTLLATKLASLAADDFALVNIKSTTTAPVVTAPTTTAPTTTAPVVTAPATSTNSGALPDSAAPTNWIYGTARTETLTGTSGHDGFKSVGGGDTMKGGLGDDTYVVYTATDKVVELAGQGIDTVETWLSSYTLPDNVENLVITGTSWTAATGNALANRIIGNDSPNTLDGRAGNDVLTGGGGNDTFVIAKGMGHDFITDFEGAGRSGGDTLLLKGFGAGATITHEQGNLFAIHAADGSTEHVTLQGVTSLVQGDYLFA